MKNQRGFTFIELILYVAILTIMLSALVPFGWSVIQTSTKSAVQQEVNANARYISEKIKQEIRRASTATVADESIVLSSALYGEVTIEQAGDDVVISRDGSDALNLNSDNVSITNLKFTNYTSSDQKTKNIQFSMTISAKFEGLGQKYQDSVDIQGTTELRN